MGSKLVRFDFKTGENEQIETAIILPKEPRSIIHGVVKNHRNKVVQDAVVKLFELKKPHNPCSLKPLTHTFTDECGQFLFGPLTAEKNYVIKVWKDNVKIRELIICPEQFENDNCDCHNEPHDKYPEECGIKEPEEY